MPRSRTEKGHRPQRLVAVLCTTLVSGGSGMIVADVRTLAGSYTGYADGIGSLARFDDPSGVVQSADGQFAILADAFNSVIRRVDIATGTVTTLAGIASTYGSADGPGENATFMFPSGVAIDGQRNAVIVADSLGHLIRRVDLASGVVSTLAGMDDGYADGVGSGANFSTPMSVAVGAAAEYAVIADRSNNCIRRLDLSSLLVTTVAGSLTVGSSDGIGSAAEFFFPVGVAVDSGSTFALVADSLNDLIRRIDLGSGAVTTLAGGVVGSSDGQGSGASFSFPLGVALDAAGLVAIVGDGDNDMVRRIDVSSAVVTTIAGLPHLYGRADGSGTTARFDEPRGVSLSADGTFGLVADFGNDLLRSFIFITVSPSNTASNSPSASPSASASESASPAPSASPSSSGAPPSASASPSRAPSAMATPSQTASQSLIPPPPPPPNAGSSSGGGSSLALGLGLGLGLPLGLLALGGAALYVASARAGIPMGAFLARTLGLGGGGWRAVPPGSAASASAARAAQLGGSFQNPSSGAGDGSGGRLLATKGSYGAFGGGV